MDIDDIEPGGEQGEEIGSDELLSDDNLRLPESANMLVRLHAVRAWLARRRSETAVEVGAAALELQQALQEAAEERRPRRREYHDSTWNPGQGYEGKGAERRGLSRLSRAERALAEAQQRLGAYEEAESLLDECATHTGGERTLVEYYLGLEELVTSKGYPLHGDQPVERSPWYDAMMDVLHRVEHVGVTEEE